MLPLALAGRDVAGQAQTGTGKTAAFLITFFTAPLAARSRSASGPGSSPRPDAELVVQIEKDAELLGEATGLTIQAVYGGRRLPETARRPEGGRRHRSSARPGACIDYEQRGYSPEHVEMLVIDEADRMFDMGFIARPPLHPAPLPPYDKRQNMLFSATLHPAGHGARLRVHERRREGRRSTPEQMTAERDRAGCCTTSPARRSSRSCSGCSRRRGCERTMIFVNTKREAEFLQ